MLQLVKSNSQNPIRKMVKRLNENQFIFPEKVYFEGFLSIFRILSNSFDFRVHSIRLIENQYNLFIDKPKVDFAQLMHLANLMYAEKYMEEKESVALMLRRGFKSFVIIEVAV